MAFLVEREAVLETLDDLLGMCIAGNGGVALISGPVATGKTALLQALAEKTAAAEALYLSASAARAESALPFGVFGQLLDGADLPAADAAVAAKLIETVVAGAAGGAAPVSVPVLSGMWRLLRAIADKRPLVIGIDDVDFSDAQSMEVLLYIVRRLESARILLVMNERWAAGQQYTRFQTELRRRPNCVHLQVRPLTAFGVAVVLGEHLDHHAVQRLGPACYRISGGNPLLVRALLEDQRAAAGSGDGELVVGQSFGMAVIDCLHRCGDVAVEVARALAVLGSAASPALLGRMLGISLVSAAEAAAVLETVGLLGGGDFRHDTVRSAVLDGMATDERVAMHARVARLQYEEGIPALIVAQHLIAAAPVDSPWAVTVLQEAADQALADNENEAALTYLRLAYQMCDDERRVAIMTAMARAEWCVNPSAVSRRLPELATALREGRLGGRHAISSIGYLLWHGKECEAREALGRLRPGTDVTADDLDVARLWKSFFFPEPAGDFADSGGDEEPDPLAPDAHDQGSMNPGLRAASVLSGLLTGEARERTLLGAEQVLQSVRLNARMLSAIVAALAALIYADGLDTASRWCSQFLEEANDRGVPLWQAVLSVARATIAVRQGELELAAECVEDALGLIPAGSWGVAVGAPLAAGILATSAMGRSEEAAAYLAMPVPEKMFQTPVGLLYLQARGRHHLAAGRYHAALNDFHTCGRLMTAWGIDLPSIVSWRNEAAHAHLMLGEEVPAERLANEQLALLGQGEARTRGASLRILAATGDPRRRLSTLREAAEMLQTSGDRLELILTLADLARAHQAAGQYSLARMHASRAHRLAQQAGAEAIRRSRLPDIAGVDLGLPGLSDAQPVGRIPKLSEAEQRVVALAAEGYTNRQVASRLYVTVSTVEQHLTRAYRKLGVQRRADLAGALQQRISDSTAS
jgi:DNA-binding CsgD family transcriptional regulator